VDHLPVGGRWEARDLERKWSTSDYSRFLLLAQADVKPSLIAGPRVLLAELFSVLGRRQEAEAQRRRDQDNGKDDATKGEPSTQ